MSYGPWPFVVVALASLGFLANSMAQQSDRFSSRFDDDSTVEFRRNDGGVAAPLSEPSLGGQFNSTVSPTAESYANQPFDDVLNQSDSGRRGITLRRDSNPEFAEIKAVRERWPTPAQPRSDAFQPEPTNPAVGAGEPDYPAHTRRNFGSQRRSIPVANPRSMSGTPRVTANDYEKARFDQLPFKTQETSVFTDLPNPADKTYRPSTSGRRPENIRTNPLWDGISVKTDNAKPGDLISPIGNNVKKPSLSGSIDDAIEGAADSVLSTARTVPTWLTLGLFFSIGANLFFGYIAMNTHSRYQDLVEDMDARETGPERSRRRSREETITPSRRQRETDEAAFLRGGIEM